MVKIGAHRLQNLLGHLSRQGRQSGNYFLFFINFYCYLPPIKQL